MKQQRRHELKTNDLSVYLQEMYETIKRNNRYIVGGIIAVLVILIIGFVVNRNRIASQNAAWASYSDVLGEDAAKDPTVLEDARRLVRQYGDDAQLGPAVLSLHGTKLYESALNMTDPDQKEERIGQLKEARSIFKDLVRDYPNRAILAAKAKMMQALIEESLIVLDEGSVDLVRSLYIDLKDSASGIYSSRAEERLADLDQRLIPLKVVEPPATAPAPAVDSPATAPASAPATAPAS